MKINRTVYLSELRGILRTLSTKIDGEVSFYPPTDAKGRTLQSGTGILATWKKYKDERKGYYPGKKIEIQVMPDPPERLAKMRRNK